MVCEAAFGRGGLVKNILGPVNILRAMHHPYQPAPAAATATTTTTTTASTTTSTSGPAQRQLPDR